MRTPRKLATLVALSAVTVGAAAGVATATGSSSAPSPEATAPPPPWVLPRVGQITADQASSFGVLRRAQGAGEALHGRAAGMWGANLDLARAVNTAGGPVRVVPADGKICLRGEDEAGAIWSCNSPEAAAEGRLILSSRDESGLEVAYGLVPDGAKSVTRVDADGAVARINTTDGVYSITNADARAVRFTDSRGDAQDITLP